MARSTFPSQILQNVSATEHFWELRCRKKCTRLRREAHVKVKSTKHTMIGALLEVAMLKKRTLLWHEAHFEVKMVKAQHAGITFGGSDVEKVHTVVA